MDIELQGQKLRVKNSGQETFFDVSEPKEYAHYAHLINLYPTMHYVAIVQIESYNALSIVVFKDKKWFDEWKENSDEKIEIIKILTPK